MSDADSNPPVGFRVIPGYPRYAIDEHGNVLSACGRGCRMVVADRPWTMAKPLKHDIDKDGYHRVTLRLDGRSKTIPIHALVLLSFVGPCPDRMMCRHIDGNPENNSVSNLVWGTSLENQHDRIRHGTHSRGEKCGMAKLKAADVLEIRARYANGETQAAIAKDFSMRQASISKIVKRLSWRHI